MREMKDVAHDGGTPGKSSSRAPWLTMGYLNDPASSEKLWAGGYLHTGDIGTIDRARLSSRSPIGSRT